MKKLLVLLLVTASSLSLSFGQGGKTIRLKQIQLGAKPQHFYIAAVKDDRTDTSSIGEVRSGALSKKMVPLNLSGGAAKALSDFLQTNLVQERTGLPIDLHIVQLEAAEKTGGLKSEAEVRLGVAFYAKGVKLTQYKGSTSVDAGIDATRYIEEMIRRGLDNMLQQFGSWLEENKAQVMETIDGPPIKVEAVISDSTDDPTAIAYSFRRPLVLQDFTGKVDELNRAAAVTSSGIDVHYDVQSKYGHIRVVATIVPFFDRTRSWCRPEGRLPRTLAHEQKHFDITAIKACELVAEIQSHTFSPENYKSELQKLYQQKEQETQEEQNRYDQETHHGLLTDVQAKWEKDINDRVHALSCYKNQ
jgi:hypothetical protein